MARSFVLRSVTLPPIVCVLAMALSGEHKNVVEYNWKLAGDAPREVTLRTLPRKIYGPRALMGLARPEKLITFGLSPEDQRAAAERLRREANELTVTTGGDKPGYYVMQDPGRMLGLVVHEGETVRVVAVSDQDPRVTSAFELTLPEVDGLSATIEFPAFLPEDLLGHVERLANGVLADGFATPAHLHHRSYLELAPHFGERHWPLAPDLMAFLSFHEMEPVVRGDRIGGSVRAFAEAMGALPESVKAWRGYGLTPRMDYRSVVVVELNLHSIRTVSYVFATNGRVLRHATARTQSDGIVQTRLLQ